MARNRFAPCVQEVAASLTKTYRDFLHHNKEDPLDNLIYLICSVKTGESKYARAYAALRSAFPSLEGLVFAPTASIAVLLKEAGRQNQKAQAIKAAVDKAIRTFGSASLDRL